MSESKLQPDNDDPQRRIRLGTAPKAGVPTRRRMVAQLEIAGEEQPELRALLEQLRRMVEG